MARVLVATVGWTVERVWSALLSVGVSGGDRVFLVNSLPREERSEAAMGELRGRIEGLGVGAGVYEVWLDPREGFPRSVARLRSLPEDCGGCRAVYLAVGGLRWLVLAAAFAAVVLAGVGRLRGVEEVELVVSLEESPSVVRFLPEPSSRLIRIPVRSGIVPELHPLDLEILEGIAMGYDTARKLEKVVKTSLRNIYRRLERLRELGLVEVADRRSGRLVYRLTPLGEMIV